MKDIITKLALELRYLTKDEWDTFEMPRLPIEAFLDDQDSGPTGVRAVFDAPRPSTDSSDSDRKTHSEEFNIQHSLMNHRKPSTTRYSPDLWLRDWFNSWKIDHCHS